MPVVSGRKRHGRSRCTVQGGVVLLEALVSIVILAIAVLGLLGVQMRTLAETQTGVRRAQAVRLIEDLAERIKSNPEGFMQLSNFVGGFDRPAGADADCRAARCTSEQLARWDVDQWRASVAATLPLGQAAVFGSSDETATGTRRQLGIVVGWRANERWRENDTPEGVEAYRKPFRIATRDANIACPDALICHVTYVQP